AGNIVLGMIGLTIMKDIRIGGAYEYQLSSLSDHSNGSFEFVLNYSFKLGVEKLPQKYRSIRYL
ncbi:MAG: type IX secretion system membrane protein PorP/SprF, partial [Bacteroidales bacterium]|nr:type IX secretion system membrane protein PorP/SprF [Bacteroidales bacterium]